jgi:hypothetical protein
MVLVEALAGRSGAYRVRGGKVVWFVLAKRRGQLAQQGW